MTFTLKFLVILPLTLQFTFLELLEQKSLLSWLIPESLMEVIQTKKFGTTPSLVPKSVQRPRSNQRELRPLVLIMRRHSPRVGTDQFWKMRLHKLSVTGLAPSALDQRTRPARTWRSWWRTTGTCCSVLNRVSTPLRGIWPIGLPPMPTGRPRLRSDCKTTEERRMEELIRLLFRRLPLRLVQSMIYRHLPRAGTNRFWKMPGPKR